LKTLAWLNTRRLLLLIVFLGIFIMAVRAPSDSDLWWHLAAGDWMRANGAIPRADPFSHTVAGQPWIEQGWLPDLLTAQVFAWAGYAGLGLLLAAIVTAALALCYAAMPAHPFARAFALILGAITSAVYWSMRPQIFSFLFFASVVWILAQHRRGRQRVVWLLPPLMLLWANCHAAWISGFILIACYVLGEALEGIAVSFQQSAFSSQLSADGGRTAEAQSFSGWGHSAAFAPLRSLLLATALSLPLIAINPHGLTMLTYPFKTVGIGALQEFIQEWASPNFHQIHAQPFIWLLLLVVAALGLAGRRARFADLITLAAFAYLALMAGRNIALFALVAAPLLAIYGQEALTNLWAGLAARYPRLQGVSLDGSPAPARPALLIANWLIVALLLVAGVVKSLQPLNAAFNEKTQAAQFPAGAVAYLQSHDLPGEMFNSYNWGGYLIWKLYPGRRVFIDGRTDLYDDAFIRRYLDVTWAGAGWEETLRQYHVGYVLVEADSFLSRYLATQPAWQEAYRDTVAVIYMRL